MLLKSLGLQYEERLYLTIILFVFMFTDISGEVGISELMLVRAKANHNVGLSTEFKSQTQNVKCLVIFNPSFHI